jgi:hypothetical protein
VGPVEAEEATRCTFTFDVTLAPGLALSGSSGTHSSGGAVPTLDCKGPVNGKLPTGLGALGDEGDYGTVDPDDCLSGGEGTGIDSITVPTADGLQEITSPFTFTYGELSTKGGGIVAGRFEGSRFTGTFEFTPTEGDCVTEPVTKARVTGEGFLHD